MNLWGRFFGIKHPMEESPFLPEKKDHVDVSFAKMFTKKGGKFLYCEEHEQLSECLMAIGEENNWESEDILCFEERLSSRFSLQQYKKSNQLKDYKAVLITCEQLIGNTGVILVCDQQIKNYKLKELPDFLIIVASTEQFVSDISEGMSKLKNEYKDKIPSNITSINVLNTTSEKGFLSYGSSIKNIYLLVQDTSAK